MSTSTTVKLEIIDMEEDHLALTNTVKDKERKIAELEDKVLALENALKKKEDCEDCMAARKQLLECWQYGDSIIGLKRMGEISFTLFSKAVEKRFIWTDCGGKTEDLWAFWQKKVSDPCWYPFKMVPLSVSHDHQKVVDPEDGYLKMLRIHLGNEVCNLVITALKEMLEYSPVIRSSVPELWNFDKNRKATLKEAIFNIHFLGQRKRCKTESAVFCLH